jgi:trimethylamine:corrinoid methyltransferase-like protein
MESSEFIRPRLTFLDQAHIAHVHQSSPQILSSIGVRINSEQGGQLSARASGVTLDGYGMIGATTPIASAEALRHHTCQLIADLGAPAGHGDLTERGEAFIRALELG